MLTLGPLTFAAPWILLGLASLPVIYWLLRVTPPAPARQRFPALRLLVGLADREETPAHTPLWLLLFRLALAALLILALAQPVWNLQPASAGSGPLVLVLDNGWAAGERWDERRAAVESLLAEAARAGRPVVLAPTAETKGALTLSLAAAGEAMRAAELLRPEPWGTDRAKVLEALEALAPEGAEIVWLTDGIEDPGAPEAAARLAALGALRVLALPPAAHPVALTAPLGGTEKLSLRVLRPGGGPQIALQLRALASDGRYLGQATATLDEGAQEALAVFELPSELRNDVVRVAIDGRDSAGAVVLLDEGDRRRPVGLVSGATGDKAQPLLSDLHYLARALEPFAEIRNGNIAALVDGGLSVLILSDVGQIVGEDRARVADWVEQGGVLVRFAGPRLAAQSDDLVPVRLRTGGRALGGALSWEKPQGLAAFAPETPFAGLLAPDDVRVTRQVLAEPSVDLADKTWARLADGTPLVTAEARGKGRIVLFHVTANADWSSLPLSGLYVEMLRRLVGLAHGVGGEALPAQAGAPALAPRLTLDGFGRLQPPPPTAMPASPGMFASGRPGPLHPPGFYGPESATVALNLFPADARLDPLPRWPADVPVLTLGRSEALDMTHALLGLGLLLVVVDLLIGLVLRGLGPRLLPRAAAGTIAAGLLAAALWPAPPLHADDTFALKAANETRLAFVLTGDAAVDEMSLAGLRGLTRMLNERTAVEAAEPIGVDVEVDELAFFPFLYWPMTSAQAGLSPQALAKVDHFMKNGGTILFDTRDADSAALGAVGPGEAVLRRLLAGLDVPPLVPVPEGHVLTKAFYLLGDFPGRFDGGQVWVEAPEAGGEAAGDPNAATASSSDGVSSIVVGANDWAAAWALDPGGRPLAAVGPGGERQRELAFRFGVNLVMYALTGNYKSDQVHVPALLERLGQ